MTTIRYFIPEDGDTESYPNVFLAPKARQQGVPPTLGQVRDAFPLPGRYHFRFKSPLVPGADREKEAMAVWMDCVMDNVPVPTWRNSIIAKVTRISMEDDEEDDDDEDFHRESQRPMPVAPNNNNNNSNNIHHTAPPPPAVSVSSAPPPAQAPAPAEPMFDVFDGPTPSPATPNLFDAPHPAAPTSGGSLLDMDAPYQTTHRANSAHSSNGSNDFFGMNPTTPSPPSGGYPGMTPQAYQQQPPQPTPQVRGAPNAFDGFSQNQGPFAGLGSWK